MRSSSKHIQSLYVKWIRPHLSTLWQQRVKLIWTVWGYYPILNIPTIRLMERLRLLSQFLRIDWHIQHAHWPGEIALVIRAIGQQRAQPGEVVVEAGCWNGGSTAKLSIICHRLGYRLLVFDSFEGVEYQPNNAFSGTYAAQLEVVKKNIQNYGKVDICEFFPGWFADTLAQTPVQQPVRVALIDCDLAKGTTEVLQGIAPSLINHGIICSQDYQIGAVRKLLNNAETWSALGIQQPEITGKFRQMVVLTAKVEPSK